MAGLQMKYFVLKPGGMSPYARASRKALREYAKAITVENPDMAKELKEWAEQAHAESYADSVKELPRREILGGFGGR